MRTDLFDADCVLHKREFEHCGIPVTAALLEWDGKLKYLWLRKEEAGNLEPFIHFDFVIKPAQTDPLLYDTTMFDVAKRRVREEFEKHYLGEIRGGTVDGINLDRATPDELSTLEGWLTRGERMQSQ
jgi:hypothetical protein